MTDTVKISVVIKAKNEAANIKSCLNSLENFADEIIVVDDNSADDTAAIAVACGARVVEGHRSPEQYVDALDITGFLAVQGEWILRIDADERMVPALAARLKQIVSEDRIDGVSFARRNMMFGTGHGLAGGSCLINCVSSEQGRGTGAGMPSRIPIRPWRAR